jgi:hypothetical protein
MTANIALSQTAFPLFARRATPFFEHLRNKNEHPEFAPRHSLKQSDVTKKIKRTRMYNFEGPQLQNTNFPRHTAHGRRLGMPPASSQHNANKS